VNAETVLALLDALEAAGVEAWVDGGWGVDALLGTQSRPHEDLDLVVALTEVDRIRQVLGSQGFALAEEQLPVRFVMANTELGRVDFHTVRFDAEGGGVQPQPGGGTFRYPPEGFTAGRVARRSVRCISAEVQVLCHLGYEPTAKDAHDMLRLHRAFGVELSAAYRRFVEEETQMDPRSGVANEGEIEWQAESSPDGRARHFRKKLGATAGGKALGASLYRVPPSAKSWPRHYHCANEEALYVLSGEGTLALGDRSVPLRPGDYVALPAGAAHAHGIANGSQADLVFLCISTMVHPDVVVYPDSGKVGVFAGAAPGGPAEESTLKAFLPLSAVVDYWKDE
jgi:uncharacterized cupin superfamily protein